MLLLMLIFGTVLLPQVHTLRCVECINDILGFCTDIVKECLPNQQCGAFSTTTYEGDAKFSVSSKRCAFPAECFESSLNFGSSKTIINNQCCNSHLCNNQSATGPSSFIPNGKKCFQCKGQDCTATLGCEGSEDRCITTKLTIGGETTTMKGCASKLVCSPEATKMTQVFSAEISCCQGDFCNSASSTSAGLLLLAAPLVSLFGLS